MTELPKGWVSAPLRDLGAWRGGGTPSKARPEFWGGSIPWVSPKDMKTTSITTAIDGITPQAVAGSAANLVPPGSILVVTRSGILAHSFPAAVNAVEVTVNQDLKALTPLPGLSCEYIRLALKGFERAILNECVKDGTTVHSIELPALMGFEIPLPPLPEQHRIVAKIEALFSELDAGQDSLTRAQAQLKLYRQSLLKAAFQGRLTADWRAANPDRLEPPETLLSRIRSERDARYKRALNDWQHALSDWRAGGEVGRKPGKPKRPRDFRDDLFDIEIDLPELPDGWAWDRLGYATCGVEYGTSAKSSVEGDVPVIRMGNLQNGLIDWADLVFTSDHDEIEQYLLSDGDVLFNRTNSPELVGKTAIYRGERPALFAGYLVRVNQIDTIALPEYICYFLNSHQAKRHGDTVKTDGVNQSNINGNKLQEYPFPFCSAEEQAQLVLILDEKISAINAIETEITTALAKITALRQSILKQAFSGRLVPQDPADEPASALLARLRADAPPARAKRKTPA